MIDYINNLKTKPEYIRKRFAFFISSGFTFLVFAGWIASYGFKSSNIFTKSLTEDNKVVIDEPVSSLKATAIGAWGDIKNMFLGSNKAEFTNDSIEVIPGNR